MKAKINIKVMTKPNLTDEEIQSHMDFNKLLQAYHQSGPKRTAPKWLVISGLSIATTAVVSTAVYFYGLNNSLGPGNNSPIQPVITVDSTTTSSTSTAIENQIQQVPPKKNEVKNEKIATKKSLTTSPKRPAKDSLVLEKPMVPQITEATPVDGYSALYAYFDKELKYPGVPADSIQGMVTVSFAITKTGSPDLIKIENSLGKAFDAECIRVIQNMPPWKPATLNGKPVQTRLSIPLSFKIKK